jgi:hypothetical protein
MKKTLKIASVMVAGVADRLWYGGGIVDLIERRKAFEDVSLLVGRASYGTSLRFFSPSRSLVRQDQHR